MIPNNKSMEEYRVEEFAKKIPDAVDMTLRPTSTPPIQPNDDFQTCSGNFWKRFDGGKYRNVYEAGVINGTYNTQYPSVDSLFYFFLASLKHSIQALAAQEDKKTTDYDAYFKNLELAQKLISNKIEKDFKNRIDGIEMLGYLHGTVNNFVNQNIKKGQ